MFGNWDYGGFSGKFPKEIEKKYGIGYCNFEWEGVY